MGVFHVFKSVQMVPNRKKHHRYFSFQLIVNGPLILQKNGALKWWISSSTALAFLWLNIQTLQSKMKTISTISFTKNHLWMAGNDYVNCLVGWYQFWVNTKENQIFITQVLKQTRRSVQVCALNFVLVTLLLKLNRYLPAGRFCWEVIKYNWDFTENIPNFDSVCRLCM